jgi:hypothetical protein
VQPSPALVHVTISVSNWLKLRLCIATTGVIHRSGNADSTEHMLCLSILQNVVYARIVVLFYCWVCTVIVGTPLIIGSEVRCSRVISSSCSTSGTRPVNLVTNPVIRHELWKEPGVWLQVETQYWLFCVLHKVSNTSALLWQERIIFKWTDKKLTVSAC